MQIVKHTYKDQVIDHIYQLLLDGELGPGDQLKESLLAEQMGISRAPIREAMKELIMNGLVDYGPRLVTLFRFCRPKKLLTVTPRAVSLRGTQSWKPVKSLPPTILILSMI